MAELTVKDLKQNISRAMHEVEEINRAARISGGEGTMKFLFKDYREALEGAGPKLKELVLDRAAQDTSISLLGLKELVDFAYPDSV